MKVPVRFRSAQHESARWIKDSSKRLETLFRMSASRLPCLNILAIKLPNSAWRQQLTAVQRKLANATTDNERLRHDLQYLTLAVLGVMMSPQAMGGPREVASRAAELIENNYFDVALAEKVSEELQVAAKAGRFD